MPTQPSRYVPLGLWQLDESRTQRLIGTRRNTGLGALGTLSSDRI